MDPITHTFTGAALAAAGLRRATPLATAALIIGANAPDIDGLTYFAGGFESIAFRRGWTHGVLALPLWPFVLTGLLLLWDRWVRRRRDPNAAPARAGPLLAITALGVLTHPTLDWLNNYGLRWLMPFDGRWFYGDALFIIDPWVWLLLGGVLFLRYSQSPLSLVRWVVFWSIASFAVLAAPALVPAPARAVWIVALVLLADLRFGMLARLRMRRRAATRGQVSVDPSQDRVSDRAAAAAVAIIVVYLCAALGASAAARAQVRAALAAGGISNVERVMVAPAAANPFGGDVVAATTQLYYTGTWSWLRRPHFELAGEPLSRPRGAIFEAAAHTLDAERFLSWARFPLVDVERAADDSLVVRFSDARYRSTGRLDGPVVRLSRDLREESPLE